MQQQFIEQQDLFLHDAEKMQWEQLTQTVQSKTIQLLAQLLLFLSNSVNHEGGQYAIQNKK
jgi:hypothetical protein